MTEEAPRLPPDRRNHGADLRASALLTGCLLVVATGSVAGDKKRQEPAIVPHIEHNGIRYEAEQSGPRLGYSQDGGIVAARDAATGELQWSRRVYPVHYDTSIESDKQEVFISAMTLNRDGASILIANEAGERFELRLSTCEVRTIAGPGISGPPDR